MKDKQWVQHISGQGEKWEVYANQESQSDWKVHAKTDTGRLAGCHWLPKSEYRLCDPPERWEDVTGECVEADAYCAEQKGRGTIQYRGKDMNAPGADIFHPCQRPDYRITKVAMASDRGPLFAFKVERKVSQ